MNARKLRTGTLTLSTLGAVWLAASSCSVLYNLNTNQCDAPEDCKHKGSAFENSTCVNHVCVAQSSLGTGGAPSTGGQSSIDTTTGGDTSNGGGSTVGGTTAIGGESSTGGSSNPATTTVPACVNTDCMAAHPSGKYTCINNKCVQLSTDNCPVILPTASSDPKYNADALLASALPIIVGGFASMTNTANPHDTQAIVNWDLAITEFNQQTVGGLPSADGSSARRPLIALICDGNKANTDTVNAAMNHLVNDIQVPGILTTLSADNLITAFNYTTSATNTTGKSVFFMSSGSANLQLILLKDNGLVWHMLGNPGLLASPVVGLVKRMEPVVNQARKDYASAHPGGPDDPSVANSLRVTVLYASDNTTMSDIQQLLTGADPSHPETALAFNNAKVTDLLTSNNLRTIAVPSTTTDFTGLVTELTNYPPHIIIAMSTAEFPASVLGYIENVAWPQNFGNRMRPYYLLSHSLFNSTVLPKTIASINTSVTPHVDTRILGVNYAQAQDDTTKQLYTAYYSRLTSSYTSYAGSSGALATQLASTENMYDAAYYLFYSMAAAAANRTSFSGTDIRTGLTEKVINTGSNNVVYVGPGNSTIIQTVSSLNQLYPPFAMALWGLMGPANFDTTTGTRNSATSAWCIQYDTSKSAWAYQADGLLYDAANKVFTNPTTGVPACLQSY